MIVLRILVNGLIMAGEIAAIAAVAAFGYHYPYTFAAVTAVLSFALGLRLEVARLRYELPFYFGGTVARRPLLTGLVGFSEALFKGILAGIAALFTFSGTDSFFGTDHDRLIWVAVVFGVAVYAGSGLVRTLSISADARPLRWGYFRLAAPLGLLFSLGLAVLGATDKLEVVSVPGLAGRIVLDIAEKPQVQQVSEFFFQLKQTFDESVVATLSVAVDPWLARAIGIVVSVNVLSGFVSALYAALIASGVRRAEDALL